MYVDVKNCLVTGTMYCEACRQTSTVQFAPGPDAMVRFVCPKCSATKMINNPRQVAQKIECDYCREEHEVTDRNRDADGKLICPECKNPMVRGPHSEGFSSFISAGRPNSGKNQ